MANAVKQKLKNGENVVGCFIGFHSATTAEMLSFAGFDFVVIDNEHGPFSWSEVEDMVRAVELGGSVPIIRVAYDPSDIQKALDRGAQGLHIPMVNTKEQAQEIVRKAKFPPTGARGTTYSVRSARYGKDSGPGYLQAINDDILIAVHIETPESVGNIADIMQVPGIDVCYIGPTDLSVTMGYAKEGPDHPDVRRQMDRVLAAGREYGVTVGTQVGNAKGVPEKHIWGAPYVGVGLTPVLYSAFTEVVQASRSAR